MRLVVKILVALMLVSTAGAQINLGKKLANRMIVVPLRPCIDTGNGTQQVWVWPDSVSLGVWSASGADTGNTSSQVVYSARTTTVTNVGLAALSVRADSIGTNTPFFTLCDTLSILNGGTTARDIVGSVILWKRGFPFTTLFSLTVAADTLTTTPTNITGGTITTVSGNVTGSVGSVTGAVGSVTGAVGSVTGNVGGNVVGSVGSVTGAVGSVTGNVGGNVVGSVASVTGAVGSVTGAVGSVTGAVGSVTGNVGGSVASVIADVGITQGGADKAWATTTRQLTGTQSFNLTGNITGNIIGSIDSVKKPVTVGVNNDKGGYSLTQAFPTNFSDLAITASTGRVTVGTNNDKELSAARLAKIDSITGLFKTADSIQDTLTAIHSGMGSITVGDVTLAPGEYTKIADSVGALSGGSNWSDAQRDSLIARMIAVRDSVINMSGWIITKFDTAFVGAGIADSSRSTSVYTSNGDTVHVFKGPREYMTFVRKHPLAYPGARPDSTEAKR